MNATQPKEAFKEELPGLRAELKESLQSVRDICILIETAIDGQLNPLSLSVAALDVQEARAFLHGTLVSLSNELIILSNQSSPSWKSVVDPVGGQP